jgi:hypothetical protein
MGDVVHLRREYLVRLKAKRHDKARGLYRHLVLVGASLLDDLSAHDDVVLGGASAQSKLFTQLGVRPLSLPLVLELLVVTVVEDGALDRDQRIARRFGALLGLNLTDHVEGALNVL